MIVSEHHPSAAMDDGICDDLPDREIGPGFVAVVAGDVQTARLIIDMGNPQAFTRRIRVFDAAGEKGPRCGEPVEFQRMFGTLIAHAV
jgi:hypothetical protein